jgi:hypothetical protein
LASVRVGIRGKEAFCVGSRRLLPATDTGVGGPRPPTPWNDFAGSADYDQEYGRLARSVEPTISVNRTVAIMRRDSTLSRLRNGVGDAREYDEPSGKRNLAR